MSKGYVYILTNPSMPGLVKIGKTTRCAEARASELFQTGVPTPFVVAHCVYTPDCHSLEMDVHQVLADSRVARDREFFAFELIDAKDALDDLHRQQVEAWLDEFIPDQSIVPCDLAVDESVVLQMADLLDVHPFDITCALNDIKTEEIAPAVARWIEKSGGRQ